MAARKSLRTLSERNLGNHIPQVIRVIHLHLYFSKYVQSLYIFYYYFLETKCTLVQMFETIQTYSVRVSEVCGREVGQGNIKDKNFKIFFK